MPGNFPATPSPRTKEIFDRSQAKRRLPLVTREESQRILNTSNSSLNISFNPLHNSTFSQSEASPAPALSQSSPLFLHPAQEADQNKENEEPVGVPNNRNMESAEEASDQPQVPPTSGRGQGSTGSSSPSNGAPDLPADAGEDDTNDRNDRNREDDTNDDRNDRTRGVARRSRVNSRVQSQKQLWKKRVNTLKKSIASVSALAGEPDFFFAMKDNIHSVNAKPKAATAGKYITFTKGKIRSDFFEGKISFNSSKFFMCKDESTLSTEEELEIGPNSEFTLRSAVPQSVQNNGQTLEEAAPQSVQNSFSSQEEPDPQSVQNSENPHTQDEEDLDTDSDPGHGTLILSKGKGTGKNSSEARERIRKRKEAKEQHEKTSEQDISSHIPSGSRAGLSSSRPPKAKARLPTLPTRRGKK